jgi:hypothetical protein
MAKYSFVTIWRFDQPIGQVWEAINAVEDYPRWWPNILYYRCLTPENPHGVGARGERAVRDLVGDGRFLLKEVGGRTEVFLFWNVSTQGRWLNRLSPLLKWLFEWNHNYVMRIGERGMRAWLERKQT